MSTVLGMLMSASIPPSASAACEFTEIAAMNVTYPGNQFMPAIPGEINGKKVDMLLDTGAYRTFLLRAEAERQGLQMSLLRERASGVGGRAATYTAKPEDVSVGPAHIHRGMFYVIDGLDKSGLAAIVGSDFLSQADLELMLSENRIKFLRFSECGDKSLAYWSADAQQIELFSGDHSNAPLVDVTINGHKLRAIVDTGATRSSMRRKTAERLGFSPDAKGVTVGAKASGIGSEVRDTWYANFDSFAIGDETIDHPRLVVIDAEEKANADTQYEIVLGRDFLKVHHVLIANSQHRFYFSYLGGRVFAAPAS